MADLVEPGAPPPGFKLVFDKSGRSQYKAGAPSTPPKRGGPRADDRSSLFTLEGRPRTAKRPKTRRKRRTRRMSELTDDESCIRPATAIAAAARCGRVLIFIGNAAAIEAAVGVFIEAAERRDAPTAVRFHAGASRGSAREAVLQRRETLQREREDALRAAVERKAAACGTKGNVVEFRKKQQYETGEVVDSLCVRGVGK